MEGPTLADRISKGPIPIDEALPIAKQIAEALEAAHEAGVIHRDLKPANIKVREDGTVKVLESGLPHRTNRKRASSAIPARMDWGGRQGLAAAPPFTRESQFGLHPSGRWCVSSRSVGVALRP